MTRNQTYTLTTNEDLNSLKKNVDMFFLIVMGSLVFFLQPGFAFYETGSVRPKNVVDVAFRNYIVTAISTLTYFLTGFALAFSEGNGFFGYGHFALLDMPDEMMALCFFQYSFAAVAATIPSGVVHERSSAIAFLLYTALTSGFIYPIATHWVATQNGWLHQLGFDDFAFSGVVHAMGGASCLAIAFITGPRLERLEPDGKLRDIPPHSIPQIALGSFIFLVGMVAFNAGSQGSISQPGDGAAIAKITLNTLICAITSAITALIYHRLVMKPPLRCWDLSSGISGSFIGMVAVCAGCNQFDFWGAFVLGISSYLFYKAVKKLVEISKIDDVVDGIAIQISGGYFGLLGVPLFKENGLVTSPSKSTIWDFMINAVGGIVIMLWSFIIILLLYVILHYFNLHRVSPSDEHIGLDVAFHKEMAYDFGSDVDVPETPIFTAGSARVSAGTRRSIRRVAKAPSATLNSAWMTDD